MRSDLVPRPLRVCVCPLVPTCGAVDAKQKGVKLAAHYSKFIDLIAEFSRTYPRLAQVRWLVRLLLVRAHWVT